MRWPNSVTISSAVSASIVWLIVAITPMRISDLITSAPRSAMRLASSWIVIVSGMTTSRTIFVCSLAHASAGARARGRGAPRRGCACARRHRSSRARVTVSLPRRRWSSARRTGAAGRLQLRAGGRAAPQPAPLLPPPGRRRHLAGGGQRGDLGGRGLAGALGDLAAGFFLLAAGLFLLGALFRLLLGAAGAPLPLRLSAAGLFLGPERAPPRRRVPPPGGGGRLRRARRGGAPRRRPCAHPAGRARGSRAPRRSACGQRRPGGAPAPAGAAGRGARRLGAGDGRRPPARPRPGSGAAPGAIDALLANLDRHRLRAAVREALAHLRRLDRAAQPQRAAGTQRQGRFCSCSLASCSFASVMRFDTVLLLRRSVRPELVSTAAGPSAPRAARKPGQLLADRASSRRHSLPPPTRRVHDPVAAERRAQLGRGQHLGARQIPRPARASLRRPPLGAVQRAQQQGGPPASHRLADPVEPGNRQAGPSGKPERVDNSAGPADASSRSARSGGTDDRPPRRAREKPLRHGALHYIAARRQPQTPSGQPRLDIGHDRPVRARRQSAAAGRDRAPRRWRCSGAAATRRLRRSVAASAAAAVFDVKRRRRLLLRRPGLCLGFRPRRTNGRVRGPP